MKIFDNRELVPDAWKNAKPDSLFYVFNPTIVKSKDGYLMTYRVVDEADKSRKTASCKLNANLDIMPGSVVGISDYLKFSNAEELQERSLEWHADPRYFKIKGKVFLLWNDGSIKPANNQFLVSVSEETLLPDGYVKRISKLPVQIKIEKNWQLFESDDSIYAVYSYSPMSILLLDFIDGKDEIFALDYCESNWSNSYESQYGNIRGGAQPVRLNSGEFLSVVHSSYKIEDNKLRYVACFVKHESTPPFRIVKSSAKPFFIDVDRRKLPKLPKLNNKTEEVVYPCGMIVEGDRVTISLGIDDEASAIYTVPLSVVENSLISVDGGNESRVAYAPGAKFSEPKNVVENRANINIPLFWWNAKNKKFDPDDGGRVFSIGNVGDIASKLIVESISGVETYIPKISERKLLGIGSIISNASNGDIIWGSGVKGNVTGFKNDVHYLDVHAVRGPLTLDFLRRQGISTKNVKELFDPGCLVPIIYKNQISAFKSIEKKDFIVIPHYKDDLLLKKRYPNLLNKFVSVDSMPIDFLEKILSSDLVISSSLHGIIFAEALGVHAMWLAPVNGEDELKYYDYYYGTGRYDVKRFASLEAALRGKPMNLPIFDFNSYMQTFPLKEVISLDGHSVDKAISNTVLHDIKSIDQNFMYKNKRLNEQSEIGHALDSRGLNSVVNISNNSSSSEPISLVISKAMEMLTMKRMGSMDYLNSVIDNNMLLERKDAVELLILAIDTYGIAGCSKDEMQKVMSKLSSIV